MENLTSLEHHLLIAMPNLADSWFEKTLVYVVEDNQHGTMGLVINLPHKLNLTQLLEHFQLPTEQLMDTPDLAEQIIMMGGPVDMEHGFILHKPPGDWQKSIHLTDNLAMTVSEDFLKSISEGHPPQKMLVCLGFAGWEKGQLNEEIQQNNWLPIPYNETLLFDIEPDQKWLVALNTLGISPESLSMEAGHG